ncbi:EAL domain-containing protein [Paenibacillus sp.]|uniref:EAL domain-containing protein n=1 Tax=Paenibacillus sp. TaxID=58172 RepID=UPI002D622E68|nr:EAL domain-containing protein [Paenibacillus sp.]HZG56440.1 EAL domain-containing protein [Paenibacillus sp.]
MRRSNRNLISLHEESYYATLFRYNLDAVFVLDAGGLILDANPAGETLSGIARLRLLGRCFLTFFGAAHADAVRDGFEAVSSRARAQTLEVCLTREDGTPAELSVTIVPLPANGAASGAIAIAKDMTSRNKALRLVDGHALALEMIAKSLPLDDILRHIILLIEEQSGALCSVLLRDPERNSLYLKAAPSLPDAYNALMTDIPIGPDCGSCGTAAYLKTPVIAADIATDPRWRDIRSIPEPFGLRACWSVPILQEGEAIGTFAMYYRECRAPGEDDLQLIERARSLAGLAIERKRQDETIRHMAFHDALTGLANRRCLEEALQRAIDRAGRAEGAVSVLFLDLDRFKLVNDSLGHRIGDELLRQVGARLVEAAGERGLVARQGGDEFVLLLDEASETQARTVAERIVAAFEAPFVVQRHELFVTTSVGVSVFPEHGRDAQTLLKHADHAMYQAKQSGRNGYRLFRQELQTKADRRLQIENHLRRAPERLELELHYQPQIDIRTGRPIGAEALLRWRHASWGLVPPMEFIPIAEETGLILGIGDWVLREACRQAAAWAAEELPPVTVSVNISARQLQHPDFVSAVHSALRASGLPAERLELELTESLTMDRALSSDVIRRLQRIGVGIAIDDFGTGYSSLHYLKHLSVNRLKIDQSFIRDVLEDQNDKDIVKAIITMSHSLGIRVVAEGVERAEQTAFLERHGCDEAQGFLFARPLPADDVAAFLRGFR